MSNNTYYAILSKKLSQYGLNINDFKQSPIPYFLKSSEYRHYVFDKFEYNKDYTWYNKPFNWKDSLGNVNNLPNEVKKSKDFEKWVSTGNCKLLTRNILINIMQFQIPTSSRNQIPTKISLIRISTPIPIPKKTRSTKLI